MEFGDQGAQRLGCWDACWDNIEVSVCYLPSAVILLVGGTCFSAMEKSCRWFNCSVLGFLLMVVDVFMLLSRIYGSEGDWRLMIDEAFVAGKPESGHLRHPLGSACPQATVAGTHAPGQGSPWPRSRGKGGLRRGEAGGPSAGVTVQLVLLGPQACFSTAVGVNS